MTSCAKLTSSMRRYGASFAGSPKEAPRVGRADDQHPRDMRLDYPRDLPRVPRHLERHPIVPAETPGEHSSCSGVVAIRPQERSSPSSTIATSQKSRCTSNATDLTTASFSSLDKTGDAAGKQHRRIRARKRNRTSRRGGHRKARAQTPIVQEPACPTRVLPESPCPGHPTLTGRARTTASERHFHAPTSGSGGVRGPREAWGYRDVLEPLVTPEREPSWAALVRIGRIRPDPAGTAGSQARLPKGRRARRRAQTVRTEPTRSASCDPCGRGFESRRSPSMRFSVSDSTPARTSRPPNKASLELDHRARPSQRAPSLDGGLP